jgi:methionine synthase II (cobalamin-independent)
VRQLRVKYKRGELTQQQYEDAIDDHIAECIKLQEDIGLDVLVHGEFERTDMVEYFGQQLSGFAFTEHGWVQSYGSRYVRPPIIFSDVARPEPISTAIANPATQIHTHMCYSEFGDIIKDIERLDADVISIENSRSNNRTLEEVTEAGYSHQIGNDVYDIHSPVVPSTEQMVQQLQEGISNLPLKQIWVNPDCGLKTRRWEEVIPALKNMVEATKIIREKAQSL